MSAHRGLMVCLVVAAAAGGAGCGTGVDLLSMLFDPVIDNGEYALDPDELHEIAKLSIGLPYEEMFETIHQGLLDRYPGLIAEEWNWHFNVAGGAMGMLTVLYAAPNEYLIFFGTPIGTEGFSGRYDAEIYDFVIDGEMWTYHEGDFERTAYVPGDAAYLGRDVTKGYRIPDHAWMLEYARGNIPSALNFGVIASTAYTTKDWVAGWGQIADYGAQAIKNLLGIE